MRGTEALIWVVRGSLIDEVRFKLELKRGKKGEERAGARTKGGGLKNRKEESVSDAERMEGKISRRWGQGRPGQAGPQKPIEGLKLFL